MHYFEKTACPRPPTEKREHKMSKFDIQTLTLGETAWAENFAGLPLAALSDTSKPTTELLIGLSYVIKKREDSTFTVERARELTMADITDILGGDESDEDEPAKN